MFRIYYLAYYGGYEGGELNIEDATLEYLEAPSVQELKQKMRKLVEDNVNVAVEEIVTNIDGEEVDRNLLDYYHSGIRFESEILEVKETVSDVWNETFKSIVDGRVKLEIGSDD